jgi:hypothetical protein
MTVRPRPYAGQKIALDGGERSKQRACLACLGSLAGQRQGTVVPLSREAEALADTFCRTPARRAYALLGADGARVAEVVSRELQADCLGRLSVAPLQRQGDDALAEGLVRPQRQPDAGGPQSAVADDGLLAVARPDGSVQLQELFRTKVDAFGRPAWLAGEAALAEAAPVGLALGADKSLGKGVVTLTLERLIWSSSAPRGLVDGDAVSFSLQRLLAVGGEGGGGGMRRTTSTARRLCVTLAPGNAVGEFYGNRTAASQVL